MEIVLKLLFTSNPNYRLNKLYKLIIIAFFAFFTNYGNAQNSFFHEIKNAQKIKISTLGEILIFNHSQIAKYSINGNLLQTFSTKEVRNIEDVDVCNPFKIRVFYKNEMKILELDNNLILRNTINFDESNTTNVDLYCNADSEHFWIYDSQENILKKYRYNSPTAEYLFTATQLHSIQDFDANNKITSMVVNNNQLFTISNSNKIISFDNLGNFNSIKTFSDVYSIEYRICNNILYLITKPKNAAPKTINIIKYDNQGFDNELEKLTKQISFEPDFIDFEIYKNKIYILKNDSVIIQNCEF